MPAASPQGRRRRLSVRAAAAVRLLASGVLACTTAAYLRRRGWVRYDRALVADAFVIAFALLAWGGSACAALAARLVLVREVPGTPAPACSSPAALQRSSAVVPRSGAVEAFATFRSALLLVGVGCASSFAGVHAETVWAIHKQQLLAEGLYGLLCTAGGMMVAAGVYELAKSMCVWFLNNTVTRSRRLLPGQPVPNEFTFVVLAVALQSALVVALLEGELLHYDMAVPGVRRSVHDCLNSCSVALFALGLRSFTKRQLFQDKRLAFATAQEILFLALCGTLLLLIFAFAALQGWQHKGWPRAAVFSFTGIRGLGVLAVTMWEAIAQVSWYRLK